MTEQGPERWKRLRDLFDQASEMEVSRRDAFLAGECQDDLTLADEVLTLLRHEAEGESFLQSPLTSGLGQTDFQFNSGDTVGNFTILQVIASGGMGTVYLAEQENPRRRVALKTIRRYLDNPEVLKRFQYEVQSLARLRHPGIAQVFEAGLHADALGHEQPYFVMEYIEGARDMATWSGEESTPFEERIRFLSQVCDAVHHAHQLGIIHRDLKPANVLVTPEGHPKVIDFGVARPADEIEPGTTQLTGMGQILGTLQYMSPEQAGGGGAPIDTRSDVYALGVIAYELLVGERPYDLTELPLHEAVAMICEKTPLAPSKKSPGLDREVDWIVYRAMEKEPERRYASASEMAADLQRLLAREAVLAGPPSSTYRLRKWMGRNLALSSALSALILAIIFGSLLYAWRERLAATEILAAKNEAEREREEAEDIVRSYEKLFLSADPTTAPRGVLTVESLLDQGVASVMNDLSEDSMQRARLLEVMALSYHGLAHYDRAIELQQEAADIRTRIFGKEDLRTLESLHALGSFYRSWGKLDDALPILEEVYIARDRILGSDDPATLSTMNNLAVLYQDHAMSEEAEAILLKALESNRRLFGDDHLDTITSIHNLANLYMNLEKLDEAEACFNEILAVEGVINQENSNDYIMLKSNLASLYRLQGRTDEAEEFFLDAIELARELLAEGHPDTLLPILGLAGIYDDQGKLDEAAQLLQKALEQTGPVLGPGHPLINTLKNNLATVFYQIGQKDEAAALIEEIVSVRREMVGMEHPHTQLAMLNLALIYSATDRTGAAVELVREVMEYTPEDHPDLLHRQEFFDELKAMLDSEAGPD